MSNMIRILAAAVLGAALCACASVPENLTLDATSNRGLIIVEATPSLPGVAMPDFSLNIARYSDAENRLDANSFGGWAGVNDAVRGPDGRYWIAAQAEPGRYVITGLTHQSFWVSCFNSGTRAFDVRPGEVVFLGRLDPLPALLTMARTLPQSTSSYVFAMDQRISIVGPDRIPDWQSTVDAYVRGAFPNVTAPVIAGGSDQVTFNTGWDMTRSKRVCGGYYAPSGAQPPTN
jgi:hypothetical protein